MCVEHYAVAASLFAVCAKFHFVTHERGGVALAVGEETDELLAHPFLGGKGYVAAAEEVVYNSLAFALVYFYVGNGQV